MTQSIHAAPWMVQALPHSLALPPSQLCLHLTAFLVSPSVQQIRCVGVWFLDDGAHVIVLLCRSALPSSKQLLVFHLLCRLQPFTTQSLPHSVGVMQFCSTASDNGLAFKCDPDTGVDTSTAQASVLFYLDL